MLKYKTSFILFLLVVVFIIYKALNQQYRLKKNFSLIHGEVIGVETYRNSGHAIFIKFDAEINRKSIKGSTRINCDKSNKRFFQILLIGRKMDVVYETDNPDNCEMLLEKGSYKKYKLQIPNEYAALIDSIAKICSTDD